MACCTAFLNSCFKLVYWNEQYYRFPIRRNKIYCRGSLFFTDEENFAKYGSDETEKLYYAPQVVVKPRTAEEISKLLILCNQHLIPVTPRGAGTGLTGGALPHLGGLVISMERFNTILNLDERNLQVTTEPGVITEVLQNAVKEKACFTLPTLLVKDLVLLEEIYPKILEVLRPLSMV